MSAPDPIATRGALEGDPDLELVDVSIYFRQYARYELALLSAYRLVRNKADAEDLVQQSVAKLFAADERAPARRPPGEWTARWQTTIKNQRRDDIGHDKTGEKIGLVPGGDALIDSAQQDEESRKLPPQSPGTDPSLAAERAELVDKTSWAVSRLEPQLRAVVLFTMWQFEVNEIAQLLSVSRKTVQRWRERAHAELRVLLIEFWTNWNLDAE